MTTRLPAALAVGALCLTPALALAAQPKASGSYVGYDRPTNASITINVDNHKITDGQVSVVLKKHGRACSPPGETGKGPTSIDFSPRHAVAPSRSGAFAFTASGEIQHGRRPRTSVSVSGKFTSATNAKVSVAAAYAGCKGTATVRKNAFYAQGR